MSPYSLILSSSPISSRFLSPFPKPKLQSTTSLDCRSLNQGRRIWKVKSELSQDAPFAIAIGACMLNSLIFPYHYSKDEEDDDVDAAIGTTDARFAVMAIMSLIPYFNWLTWIFAWMDTGKRRYAVYAAVYLAPYIRTNLSLSPEESWLPIASIVLCIIHVQLEASVINGDIDGFNFFQEAAKRLGSTVGSKDDRYKGQKTHEGRRPNNMNLPSGERQLRDEIRKWGIPRKSWQDSEHSDLEQGDVDDKMDH